MQKGVTRGVAAQMLTLMLAFVWGNACAQSTQVQATVIGNTVVVVGRAFVLGAGQRVPLARGTAIVQGSTIETGADGYVYIATVDNGFISVRPESSLSFERYEYDPAAPQNTLIRLMLHKGVVREISGDGARAARGRYRMNTPVAALGVRGTDFSVFTDANVTRATVRSGGIVMTPLGVDCAASGIGPCEGPAAAQLFADGHKTLVEVDRNGARPVTVDARLAQLVPDHAAPPLRNEDNDARAVTTMTTVEPGVAPGQLSFPTVAPSQPAPPVTPVPPPAPVTPAPPPVPPPPVVAPQPEAQQIFWGRFAPIASLPANTTLAALLEKGGEQVGTILPFAMTRTPQQAMVMPTSGSFNFGLQSYEAYVVDSTAGTASAAAISNGLLSIDFGARSFTTQLDVTANGSTHVISGQGGVSSDGKLFSGYTSPAAILGAVAGKNATQAGYVFTQGFDGKTTAIGATLWGR
jgi:hypothetical protein